MGTGHVGPGPSHVTGHVTCIGHVTQTEAPSDAYWGGGSGLKGRS